jgi:hypothetical protein
MNMKHLRTFESFSVKINEENETIDKQAIETEIQTKFEEVSPEEKEQIKSELEDFASKHGLSFEDLKDADKVQAALERVQESLNEGWFGDKWGQFKNWIGGFLVKVGLIGSAATIIGAATAVGVIGEAGMQNPDIQATMGLSVGIAFAVSILAYTIGASLPGEGKKIASNLGSGASAGRK